jgi:UDP-2-acetamido-3-amino-2,3-dideoxy-glucuronate N-acetyltransferase
MTKTVPLHPFFIHESSYVDDGVEIGAGTQIWHFCHVMKGSRIGRQCRIGQNVVIGPNAIVGNNVKIQNTVSVYQGVVLEDDVFCGPSMVFTNVINPRSHVARKDEYKRTLVRRGASIGANVTIVCGVTLGKYCFIGAGAVVNRDVPDYALIVGNPGRLRGWMCACGIKLPFEPGADGTDLATCSSCDATYRKEGPAVVPVEETGAR